MGMNPIKAVVGVAKQAARGTIAVNPTFAHGLLGGSPIASEVKQAALEVTSATRTAANVVREGVSNGGEISAVSYLATLGLYLLGAYGTDTVTGTGPYVHTYSVGDLPYLSVFEKGIDAAIIFGLRDCKVDELSLKWDGSKPVEVTVKHSGTVLSFPATFTAGTDLAGSESFLTPVGGTFQTDMLGATLATARITKGEVTWKNNVGAVDPSAQIESFDQQEGRHEVSLKLTIVPDDLSDWRKTQTGSAAGTASASNVPYGSVSLLFKENAGGTGQLLLTGSKVAFLTGGIPDADPKGGPIEIELAGIPVGTNPIVAALTNAIATY